MTTISRLTTVFALAASLAGCYSDVGQTSREAAPPAGPAQVFDMLDPYGQWLSVPGLGEIWQPHVPYDWSPYRDGRWEWTDRGWMWVGDEQFAWIVYHYGSWDYRADLGWVWIPGYTWFPARVAWFTSDQMIGWAPLPPSGVVLPRPEDDSPGRWWSFVEPRYFAHAGVNGYRYRGHPYFGGSASDRPPDVSEIGRMSGEEVPRMHTESETVKRHGHNIERVGTRREPPLGVSPQPPSPPPTQPPMNLPIGRQRGEVSNPSPAPQPTPPVRKAPKRPVHPAQPAPGTQQPPSRGRDRSKPTSIQQEKPVVQDTVKSTVPPTSRPGRRR